MNGGDNMLVLAFMAPWLSSILWVLLGFVIGAIVAWVFSQKFFKKQLKKNPPVNEKMIRAMFLSMGRKPSEAQIRAIMNSMKKHQ